MRMPPGYMPARQGGGRSPFALMAKGPGRHSGCSVHFPGQGAIPASPYACAYFSFRKTFFGLCHEPPVHPPGPLTANLRSMQ